MIFQERPGGSGLSGLHKGTYGLAACVPAIKQFNRSFVMNVNRIRRHMMAAVTSVIVGAGVASCGAVYDDLDPCTVTYRIKFKYDYNMKFADAFPAEVHSVNVWAFDSEGKLAWKGYASGEELAAPGFAIDMDVAPGVYTIMAWGGLGDKSPFVVADGDNPASVKDLDCELTLKDATRAAGMYADYELRGLYHGLVTDVELKRYVNENAVQEVMVPLVKDTNLISVMLQNSNGTAISSGDFDISIRDARNSLLAYDNAVLDGQEFSYYPWAVSYGQTDNGKEDGVTSVSTLLAEMSTSRLMADSRQVLSVVRATDNKEIIHIPLVQYLLLVKGNYHRDLTDQEYLDRQDEYSMIFLLTEDNNWNIAAGIYINSWAVVPPQNEDNL